MNSFLKLFDGWPDAHLQLMPGNTSDSGKVRGDYSTIPGPLTEALSSSHFNGKISLGVSPLRADGTVVFGAIDVDITNMSVDLIEKCFRQIRATSAFFWSKSRGIHIYVFAAEPIPAKTMVDYLRMLRKRLPKRVQAASKEIFPKQTDPSKIKRPSAINLPMFGFQREFICGWTPDSRRIRAGDDESPAEVFDLLLTNCRVRPDFFNNAIKHRQVVIDTANAGYRVPEDAPGRQELLWRIACSMQARGWPDQELESELRRLNVSQFHDLFEGKGPLEETRLRDIIKRVKKQDKGTPAQLNFRDVEKFNRDYAIIDIDGRMEFLDLNADDFRTYNISDFKLKTANRQVLIKDRLMPVFGFWLRDVDRAEFDGVVTEPLGYSGKAFNIWRGFAVTPKSGDPSLFLDVIQNVLCDGDEQAAKWLIHWIADAIQRPTEPSPPSALALRGPQGHGKSYFVEFLTAIFGTRYVQWVQESDRLFSRFNRELFGATFVAAEEAIFHGSEKVAATLKAFISSPIWTYEAKHKAVMQAKNVHRLIATTNSDQAVHLDHDDRRWTVIEVPRRWDISTEEGKAQANKDWEPYWNFLRGDGPQIVLDYLLGLNVDREFIRYGYITRAKADDKIQSNPVLAVLDEIAESGIAPHDLRGDGVISAKALCDAVAKQGGASARNRSSRQIMAEFDKLCPECTTVRNAWYVSDIKTFSSSEMGAYTEPLIERDQRGRDLGELAKFRKQVTKHTGRIYDHSDAWSAWQMPALGDVASVQIPERRREIEQMQERGNCARSDEGPF